jgi:hypothetical protein
LSKIEAKDAHAAMNMGRICIILGHDEFLGKYVAEYWALPTRTAFSPRAGGRGALW